jgi:PAS domain S-box-containing protein
LDPEEQLLRSVALQNARSIMEARQRAEAELLQTRDALRDSEERLRAMFNQAAVGIAVASLEGRFLDVNSKFAGTLGYRREDLLALTFAEITHPEDLAATLAAVRTLLDGLRSEYSMEKRYIRRDGMELWSLTTVTLLKDAQGRPLRFMGVIEDITARKRMEAALREETRILELLNESGKALASTLDLQALLQKVTDAATQLSGAQFGAFFYNTPDDSGEAFQLHTLSGASRESFEDLGKPRATALFGLTFRGEGPVRCDDVLQDPRCGAWRPHLGTPPGQLPVRSCLAVPVRSRSGEVIGGLFFGHGRPGIFTARTERLIVGVAAQAGIAIDNARLYEAAQQAAEERKALLERERAARSAAERLSEMKDEFLATLSHELRTPLNAILGWAHVLRTRPRTESDVLRALDTIERNARAQTQLIEDLLDMSRITAGKLRLDVQSIHPVAFIDAAIETVKPAADAKRITLHTQLDPDAGPVLGDSGRLQQVIWNLLSNAIKFTPGGGSVQVTVGRAASQVEISVADTGAGIRPEFIPHLFERFRQDDASTTRQYGGLGLGLSIVKRLVELHGGTVHVASPGENQGTTVTVRLPLAAVHRSARMGGGHPASTGAPAPGAHRTELAGITVLVVDDHPDARDLVTRVLEDCGARVTAAGSAEEALSLVQSQAPHVLVTDIGMPETDGFELLRRIRALDPERGGRIPAVALTAFARPEDRTLVLRSGFQVHVPKPVDPAELVATVASVARRAEDDTSRS